MQRLQTRREVRKPCSGHVRAAQVELGQPGERRELGEPGVRDLRPAQAEARQVGHRRQPPEILVRQLGAGAGPARTRARSRRRRAPRGRSRAPAARSRGIRRHPHGGWWRPRPRRARAGRNARALGSRFDRFPVPGPRPARRCVGSGPRSRRAARRWSGRARAALARGGAPPSTARGGRAAHRRSPAPAPSSRGERRPDAQDDEPSRDPAERTHEEPPAAPHRSVGSCARSDPAANPLLVGVHGRAQLDHLVRTGSSVTTNFVVALRPSSRAKVTS